MNGTLALPLALRRPIGTAAILAALVVAVLAVQYSGDIAAGWVDRSAQTAVESLLPQPGRAALLIDLVGAPLVAVVLAGLLAAACLALGRRCLAVVTIAGLGVSGVATTALKPAIDRTIHGGYCWSTGSPHGDAAPPTVPHGQRPR